MKIAVAGLWHLGSVMSACLSQAGYSIIAYDPDENIINSLQKGESPVYEPELNELIKKAIANNLIHFTNSPQEIEKADIIWVAFDTPVDENDVADSQFVINEIEKIANYMPKNSLVIISSQVSVGTTRKIQTQLNSEYAKNLRFAYIPENLRLGKAIEVFTRSDRFIVGVDEEESKACLTQILGHFSQQLIWMSIESAEMTKHALNAFLATSVTFINEIASLCEKVSANAKEVEAGLKSEERIGTKAYLKPGGAIAGGTLLRDINFLNKLADNNNSSIPLLSAVIQSNQYHKDWLKRKVSLFLNQLENKVVTVLGLTYKVNTNTLRRSSSVEICRWLHEQGIQVNAFDPVITSLPTEYNCFINLKDQIQTALENSEAVVIATEWKDFKEITSDIIFKSMRQPIVIDPNGFLFNTLGQDKRIRYCSVGTSL